MTYLEFLAIFLLPPILFLIGHNNLKSRITRDDQAGRTSTRRWRTIAIISLIAVIYTTPWDNYLVANRVWWYDPALVVGIELGWVPLEEYLFFILQTILTGKLTLLLAEITKKVYKDEETSSRKLRGITGGAASLILVAVIAGFFFQWEDGTYLLLLLAWALPPIALQLFFGADILWRHRWVTFFAILIPTIYLSVTDSLAISSGTWVINPEKSLRFHIGSLPLEEILFFGMTNTLIVFAVILMTSSESQRKLGFLRKYLQNLPGIQPSRDLTL